MDSADVIIVGAGLAGLSSALYLAEKCPHLAILVMDKHDGLSSNTRLAQGGIAAVTDMAVDSLDAHIADTMAAGRGKNDLSIVRRVITRAPEIIQDLLDWGVEFDSDSLQRFNLGLEGGHSFPRIIHHKDKTGLEIILKLRRRIQRYPNIHFLPFCLGVDLLVEKNKYQGIKVYFPKIKQIKLLRSAHLILATGGAGQVFQASSNPPSATGDGLAMAIRAGAKVADLEYFQFHPTALFQPGAVRNLLITEALRGAGAFVINNKGERFLFSIDPRGELATRDIVTRVIMEEMGKNDADCVYLDARHIGKERLLSEFPQVYENCLLEGYDLSKLGKMGMGASVTIVTFILRFTGYLSENIIEKTMQYYHSKTLPNTSVDTLRPKVEAALKEEGFGILTEIDIQATMKKKLGKDYLPHLILGACNPVYADKVLTIAPQISTMLPCNVTLRELEDGGVEVSIIDPLAAMGVVENPDIEIHAAEVNDKLKKVLASI